MNNKCPKWLKDCVIYSIYPQSFYDSNNDGIGDISGIIEKLPYIKELGCTAIWMNPIFESDFLDAGYDVIDFYKIAPRYGTEEDLIRLCEAAHGMGIKVLLDLVAGHTSDKCPWFLESAKKEKNAYSDRYIWAPEKPDNYYNFKENEEGRQEHFMFNYYDVQPSINYGFATVTEPWQLPVDHPAAIENQNELIRIIDYWFKKGVDGFRVDMAKSLIKDDPEKIECQKLWRRIRKWMDENYPEHALISEWSVPDQAIPAGFHIDMMLHNGNSCLTTLFRYEHFAHKMYDVMFGESYFRKEALGSYDEFLKEYLPLYDATREIGYMSFITGSHDIKRLKLGRDMEDMKAAYAFIMTMPGVPINYYGDEIGMEYLNLTSKEGGRDRTGSRTPMQWCKGKNCGFSESDTPYLPVDTSEKAPTVEEQLTDESSLLNFVKSLISLRRGHSALWADAQYQTIQSGYPVVYDRISEDERIRVVINASAEEKMYEDTELSEILLKHNVELEGSQIKLGSRSCVIYTV